MQEIETFPLGMGVPQTVFLSSLISVCYCLYLTVRASYVIYLETDWRVLKEWANVICLMLFRHRVDLIRLVFKSLTFLTT